ncbi:hypothetical protein HME7025_01862 [Aquirufa nivalisilvae]|uniref:Uncharacterized protein n=1 Tax=Aquirufa nivalisilvae TaxID=2516557 RepID=A0A2S2DWJ2_9BACT|nr:hypothetical protein [Aquirufa nivalisilvae]AWL09713.1 hypothetical protein HME7025_01862 [Aquirufa nivalisilvae]
MSNYYNESEPIREFYAFEVNDLLRAELGVKSFTEIKDPLNEINLLIKEMIKYSELNDHIPQGIKEQVITIVTQYNDFSNLLKSYNFDLDAQNSFRKRTSLINNIKEWHKNIYSGKDSSTQGAYFLLVYNTIKTYNLSSFQNDKNEIEIIKQELISTTKKAEDLFVQLQSKATEETVQDYALIFQLQARQHSYWSFSISPFILKFGNAQTWLVISILVLSTFVWFAINLNSIIPIDLNKAPSVVTLELLSRLLIVSVSVYMISFCFKQYNVQNHLATLNKHRQNTLNSFKLFISSIDQSDSTTRNALMIEVAKAIYENGNSGYISSKDGGDSSPSIIEMTRIVGQK